MRRALLLLGLVALAAAWFAVPSAFAEAPFSAHMTAHMGVVAVAAPLLALGLAGGRLDPVAGGSGLLSPVPASMLELAVVWAWHMPALHHAARHSALGLVAEQASFLGSGLLLWMAVLGGGAEDRRTRRGPGILALLLTFMHMTLLGALLALAPRPLYAHLDHGSPGSELADQQLGGAIMLIAGGISYLAGGLALTVRLLRERLAPRIATGLQVERS